MVVITNIVAIFIVLLAYAKVGNKISWWHFLPVFIPTVWYEPKNSLIAWLFLTICMLTAGTILVKKVRILLFLTIILAGFWGGWVMGDGVSYPININKERWAWNILEVNRQIEQTSLEATYLPYRIRDLVFGKWYYLVLVFSNYFHIVNLTNQIIVWGWWNLPIFILGFSKKNLTNLIAVMLILAGSAFLRSFDSKSTYYLVLPLALVIYWSGIERIKREIWRKK